jgi:cytochrome P450
MTTVHYDPFSTETRTDPYAHYAELRKHAPVHRLEGPGFYLVSRYKDVQRVVKQPEIFSSRAMQRMMMSGMSDGIQNMDPTQAPDPKALEGLAQMADGLGFNPIEMMTTPSVIASDPPNHSRLRNIVNRGFTPRRIAALEPRLREIASAALDRMLEKDEFDLVRDFTIPLPVMVIAELLGVEAERFEDFKRWSDTLIQSTTGSASGTQPAEMLAVFKEFNAYFMEQIELRRRNPKDDLMSQMTAAEDGEAALTPMETLMFAVLLLVAGNETTTNLMGNGILALLDEPEQFTRVQSDPKLAPKFVEEALRFDGPVQMLFRETTQDVELAGTKIPQGSVVLPIFASANRDEAQFPDADHFDIDRDTRGHVAFGLGIHFCLGASLARLEARVGFEELFKRVQRLHRLESDVEYVDSFLLRGVRRLMLSADRVC